MTFSWKATILSLLFLLTNSIGFELPGQVYGGGNGNNRCASDSVSPKKQVVCFYRVEDEFRPFDLDPCLCTHIIYSYVAVKDNFAFIAGKKGDLKYLSSLRSKNPSVKILVSLRPTGASFTLEDPKNITYPLPPSNTLRHRFAKRIRDFVVRHGLDGVDVDYEYFKQDNHSNNRKRDYLISIIQSISSSINLPNDGSKILLTLTTSRYPRHLADYYDFSEIYKYVDFVNIPAFNFDQNGKQLVHPSKLHGMSEMENMDAIMDLAIALGLPASKLVVGVPTFGTLYRLVNSSQTTPGSPSVSWSENNQPITTISHSKICDVRDKSNWTLLREKDLTAPYIFINDKWIGFDDEISIKLKAKYVILRKAAGLAFFHLNDDDPTGQCGLGPYPLVQSALAVFSNDDHLYEDKNVAKNFFNNTSQHYFQSFVDVVQKHGNIERVTDEEEEAVIESLPCRHQGYMKYPEDCSRFYRCLRFSHNDHDVQRFQYSCPPGLVFDETNQICNWPSWSASCTGSGEITPTTKKDFVCPKAGYFQDPDNCEYFHYCSDLGKMYLQPYEFKCPFELGFDEQKLQCNWKWLVKGCQYVPPEQRIVKDLQQILPQDVVVPDLETIEPASSELSELFEEMPDEEELPLVSGDEFQKRSDSVHEGSMKVLENLKEKFLQIQQTQGSKIKKLYQETQSNSRLQALSTFLSKMMGRLKGMWAPTAAESRADRTNSATWLNPLNHLIPKFKPFRKGKAPGPSSTKAPKMKSPKPRARKTRNKMGFDKNPFKMPKLSKFSKKKKSDQKKPSQEAQISTQRSQKYAHITPIFAEESVQVPRFAKPTNFAPFSQSFGGQSSKQPFKGLLQAESVNKPTVVRATGNKNHFNSFRPKNIQPHVNILNDYQVAGSFAINTFGEPQQSTVTKEFSFVPTKAPVNFYYHVTNNPMQRPRVTPVRQTKPQNNFNKPLSASSNLFPEFKPFRHTYGLPSVNIRYSYIDDGKPKQQQQQHQSVQPQLQLPVTPQLQHRPKQKPKPVQIETTRYNFPSDNPEFTADAQLESFLRDKFISNGPVTYKPNSPSTLATLSPLQITNRPASLKPNRATSKPKPQHRQVSHLQSRPFSPPTFPNIPPVNLRPSLVTVNKTKPTLSKPKPVNQFSSFITTNVEPLLSEREKYFTDVNPKVQEVVHPLELPKVANRRPQTSFSQTPTINYKLTPITDNVFKLNNQSTHDEHKISKQTQFIETPMVMQNIVIKSADPIREAIQNANRFEYIRSTQKPAVKFESYEWTTPTSLRNDKINVNFNLMTSKDINAEIDRKKHLFTENNQSFKPLETPISLNKDSLFTSIDDVFSDYRKERGSSGGNSGSRPTDQYQFVKQPEFSSFAPLPKTTTEPPTRHYTVERLTSPTTTPYPWLSTVTTKTPEYKPNLNDTEEYFMFLLNNQKDMPDDVFEEHLRNILSNSKNFGRVYNVEANGAQTLMALLPKYQLPHQQEPFVYKGDNKLIQNLSSSTGVPNSDVLKIDIPKPESELFHSIFDKMKDEYGETEQPYFPSSVKPPRRKQPKNQRKPTTARTTTTTTTPRPYTPEEVFSYDTSSSTQPWFHPNQPTHDQLDAIYELGEQPIQKLNRSNNAWYDDVAKFVEKYPNYDLVKEVVTESPQTIRTVPTTAAPRYTRPFTTVPPTTTQTPTTTYAPTTTSTTSTPTTTQQPSSVYEEVTLQTKPPRGQPRRPQLRRKPGFGSRQRGQQEQDTRQALRQEPKKQEFQELKPSFEDRRKAEIPADYEPKKQDSRLGYDSKKQEHKKQESHVSSEPKKASIADDYVNQNNFGQKLNRGQHQRQRGQQRQHQASFGQVGTTEEPTFYEEELPDFAELNYPETQNHHHPTGGQQQRQQSGSVVTRASTTSTTTEPTVLQNENTYYPDSTIHNLRPDKTGIPESACTRAGIFQHPNDCNKYYECYWDKHINKFTLQPFECPVKLAFDSRIIGCGSPNDPTVCVQY